MDPFLVIVFFLIRVTVDLFVLNYRTNMTIENCERVLESNSSNDKYITYLPFLNVTLHYFVTKCYVSQAPVSHTFGSSFSYAL